jgi:hypothetical protein
LVQRCKGSGGREKEAETEMPSTNPPIVVLSAVFVKLLTKLSLEAEMSHRWSEHLER